jgi:hypothetical protein
VGKVTDARHFSDVRVDDVLGHVAFHVGEEGAEQGLLAPQQQDRRGNLPERLRRRSGPQRSEDTEPEGAGRAQASLNQ